MVRVIQVFIQLGSTVGHGAEGDGAGGTDTEVCPMGELPVLGMGVGAGEEGTGVPVAGGGGAGVLVSGGGGTH